MSAQNEMRAASLLRQAGLRPTRQRVGLTALVFDSSSRHLSAESLYAELRREGISASLSCVYNSLRRFHEVGLVRRVPVYGNTTYYDTQTRDHHHFHVVDEDRLIDVSLDEIDLGPLPAPPEGYELIGAELVLKLRRSSDNRLASES